VCDEPTLAGVIPLSQLADFLREHLTVDVEVFEESYSEGYVVTRVTVRLGDTRLPEDPIVIATGVSCQKTG